MYKIIIEISPSGFFGLPDGDKIVWPSGEFFVKILKDSVSNIVFKVSKYRNYTDAINLEFTTDNFRFRVDDNFIIFECLAESPILALEFCQNKINKFIRLFQFKYSNFFQYKIREIYFDNKIIPMPSSGRVEGIDIIVYNLDKINESLRFGMDNLYIVDNKANRFLDYFDRAIFLQNIYSEYSEKHLNERFFYFLLPEIFLNYFKSISTIIGDPSVDKDYQKRYKEYGFSIEFFQNTIEVLRNIRNDKDISHYSLQDNLKLYEEIKEYTPRIKTVATEVFDQYLSKLAFPK